MSKQQIIVFTDGASKRNPGPGGWGVVIVARRSRHRTGRRRRDTTNNKMELTGAIQALAHLQRHTARSAIYTDSTYVIQGIPSGSTTGYGAAGRPRPAPRCSIARCGRNCQTSPLRQARADRVALRPRTHRDSRKRARRRDRRFVRRAKAGGAVRRPLLGYPIAILDLPDDTSGPPAAQATGSGTRSKGAAYPTSASSTASRCACHLGGVRGAREGSFGRAVQEGDERGRTRRDPPCLARHARRPAPLNRRGATPSRPIVGLQVGRGLRATGCGLRATGCGLRATGLRATATGYRPVACSP